ncbi:fluoride efflux transporter CrcB [Fulvivirga lutea]|uniref:Fluoride-specific ion channel FluC n=1 Tax=Fulvivirga lutea TaxID=2810512 RepID=A0A974WGQ7_9BACT|nr:fluoride efflux transporter CrcB [Fulvivirga lutea]QSE97373.1 fluoride efflux transporter CrcB [Fulvivirga lutea]
MIKNILLVGLGGFIGSTLRYVTYLFIDKRFELTFPLSTFTVNIIGSFLLGIIMSLAAKDLLNEPMRLLLAVGICGSFTTFSTFALENLNLLSGKEVFTSFLYIAASVVLGIGAAFAGQLIVK